MYVDVGDRLDRAERSQIGSGHKEDRRSVNGSPDGSRSVRLVGRSSYYAVAGVRLWRSTLAVSSGDGS
jgi:hypothetical protein